MQEPGDIKKNIELAIHFQLIGNMIIIGVIYVIYGIWSLGSCTILPIHKELINLEVTSSKKLKISSPPNTHFTTN